MISLRFYTTVGTCCSACDDSRAVPGMLKYKLGVGPIFIFSTCNQAEAEQEQQNRLDYLDEVGHQGIEITPVF